MFQFRAGHKIAHISGAVGSRVTSWVQRLYTAVVTEDIPHGFRSQVLLMRVTGAWPTTDNSFLYKCLTIAFFSFVGIFFPLSLPMNILFIDFKIDDALQHSFASMPAFAATFKVVVIYWRLDNIRAFFRLHTAMLSRGGRRDAAANDQVARMNIRIHAVLTLLYVLYALSAVVQNTFAQPADKIIVSTMNLPYDFARSRAVYVSGLMFQIVCSVCACMLVALEDSLFIPMINTVCCHLIQLKERLRLLGTSGAGDVRFYSDLIDCCKRYEDCLR